MNNRSPVAPVSGLRNEHDAGLGIVMIDDILTIQEQGAVHQFLTTQDWSYGWRSSRESDAQRFWHRHFAGATDELDARSRVEHGRMDCAEELLTAAPVLHDFWRKLKGTVFSQYYLIQCYANAMPYGTHGSVHNDSLVPGDYTAIYYPHMDWHPDWGGETILFNQTCTDILTAAHPKPNRLLVFPAFVRHVARGVSGSCPVVRITLMFKIRKLT
jgi:SM-20-related protein